MACCQTAIRAPAATAAIPEPLCFSGKDHIALLGCYNTTHQSISPTTIMAPATRPSPLRPSMQDETDSAFSTPTPESNQDAALAREEEVRSVIDELASSPLEGLKVRRAREKQRVGFKAIFLLAAPGLGCSKEALVRKLEQDRSLLSSSRHMRCVDLDFCDLSPDANARAASSEALVLGIEGAVLSEMRGDDGEPYRNFLFTDFPRKLDDCREFEQTLGAPDFVVVLDVDVKVAEQMLAVSTSDHGAEGTFEQRWTDFVRASEAVAERYQDRLLRINATGRGADEIYRELKAGIRSANDNAISFSPVQERRKTTTTRPPRSSRARAGTGTGSVSAASAALASVTGAAAAAAAAAASGLPTARPGG